MYICHIENQFSYPYRKYFAPKKYFLSLPCYVLKLLGPLGPQEFRNIVIGKTRDCDATYGDFLHDLKTQEFS